MHITQLCCSSGELQGADRKELITSISGPAFSSGMSPGTATALAKLLSCQSGGLQASCPALPSRLLSSCRIPPGIGRLWPGRGLMWSPELSPCFSTRVILCLLGYTPQHPFHPPEVSTLHPTPPQTHAQPSSSALLTKQHHRALGTCDTTLGTVLTSSVLGEQ